MKLDADGRREHNGVRWVSADLDTKDLVCLFSAALWVEWYHSEEGHGTPGYIVEDCIRYAYKARYK